MFIGSNKTVLQNFLRHDTAYALFKLHRVLHYSRHDTAGALKYFTVLSYENKKEIDCIVLSISDNGSTIVLHNKTEYQSQF
jgi:hypothetical protein